MRTTLDLDDRVLAAARAKASAESISLGRAVSLLALSTLEVAHVRPEGFPVFEPTSNPVNTGHMNTPHVITDEMVADHRDG